MKILTKNKFANWVLVSSIGILVILMLSSFILRISATPVINEIDASVPKQNEIERVIQVNILNACGKDGLASQAKHYLMERGFDVVEIGNNDISFENSIVVDRVGDFNTSQKVANAVGIGNDFIASEIDSNLCVRATIIIGKDYFTLKPFEKRN